MNSEGYTWPSNLCLFTMQLHTCQRVTKHILHVLCVWCWGLLTHTFACHLHQSDPPKGCMLLCRFCKAESLDTNRSTHVHILTMHIRERWEPAAELCPPSCYLHNCSIPIPAQKAMINTPNQRLKTCDKGSVWFILNPVL